MAVVLNKLRQYAADVRAQQINPGWYISSFVLGLAAGRGMLGGLAPFAAPTAAMGAVFFQGRASLPIMAGMIIGLATRPSMYAGLKPYGDYLLVAAIFIIARHYKKYLVDSWFLAALLAGGVNFIAKYICLVAAGAHAGFLPGLFSESALVAVFTIPFHYIFSDYKRQKGLFSALVLVLVYYGLGDFRLGPTNVREVLGRSVLLVVAGSWGAGWGAAAGVILGIFSGSIVTALSRTGFFAATGFCSGILKGCGPPGVILGFFLSSLLFSASYGQPGDLMGHLWASLIAIGVYLVSRRFLPFLPGREKKVSYRMLLKAEVGIAQRAKPLETLCGDSFGISHLEPRRLLLTVSDGMGSGINAARESRIVVKLIEQLLGSGVQPEAAAGIVNTALYLRGGEESAATIDTAVADLDMGSLEFLKVGAPPSFLKRGEVVELIRSVCWPAGILDEVDPMVLAREIVPGDILVMASDGITEANQISDVLDDWLYNYLRDLPVDDAQVIADLILKHALKTAGFENRDDMTVMVVLFGREEELE
ncbi:MAG TPA: SpoIIE family protein phosphatase [Syntrophaceticus sp.]|nr:SpoIIE family protein phosphatase [Syntrophaceticus sp.]